MELHCIFLSQFLVSLTLALHSSFNTNDVEGKDTIYLEFNDFIIGRKVMTKETNYDRNFLYMEIDTAHLLVLTDSPLLFNQSLFGKKSFQDIEKLYSNMHIERDDYYSLQDDAPYLVTLSSLQTKVEYIMDLPDTTYSLMDAIIGDRSFSVGNIYCGDSVDMLNHILPQNVTCHNYDRITMLYPLFLTKEEQQKRHIKSFEMFSIPGGADAITFWITNGVISKIQIGSIWSIY